MAKQEYRAYLQSDRWAEIRTEVYRRTDGLCVICQQPAGAVHHRYYPDNLEDDTTAGKWAVCSRCHRALHGIHEHTPRERAENTATRAIIDFAMETGLPVNQVLTYTKRIMFIMARYHGEGGK